MIALWCKAVPPIFAILAERPSGADSSPVVVPKMVVVYSICGPIAGVLVSECVPYFCLVGVSALCTTALCTHWTMECEFVRSLSLSSLYDARANVGCATVTAFVALFLVAIIGKLSRTVLAVVAELRSCVLNADDALLVRRCRRYVCVNVVVTCACLQFVVTGSRCGYSAGEVQSPTQSL